MRDGSGTFHDLFAQACVCCLQAELLKFRTCFFSPFFVTLLWRPMTAAYLFRRGRIIEKWCVHELEGKDEGEKGPLRVSSRENTAASVCISRAATRGLIWQKQMRELVRWRKCHYFLKLCLTFVFVRSLPALRRLLRSSPVTTLATLALAAPPRAPALSPACSAVRRLPPPRSTDR